MDISRLHNPCARNRRNRGINIMTKKRKKSKGWPGDSYRHSLSSRGIPNKPHDYETRRDEKRDKRAQRDLVWEQTQAARAQSSRISDLIPRPAPYKSYDERALIRDQAKIAKMQERKLRKEAEEQHEREWQADREEHATAITRIRAGKSPAGILPPSPERYGDYRDVSAQQIKQALVDREHDKRMSKHVEAELFALQQKLERKGIAEAKIAKKLNARLYKLRKKTDWWGDYIEE